MLGALFGYYSAFSGGVPRHPMIRISVLLLLAFTRMNGGENRREMWIVIFYCNAATNSNYLRVCMISI